MKMKFFYNWLLVTLLTYLVNENLLNPEILGSAKTTYEHNCLSHVFLHLQVKKYYSIGSRGQCYKTFYARNLRIFVIN